MRDVCIYGDPILRKKAVPVAAFDDNLKKFVDEMIETMHEKDGVGLAAPQVGESVRLAVIDAGGGDKPPYVLINPEITWSSEERGDYEEGCLSIPGINCKVNRPLQVSVTALNERGEQYTIEKAEGLLARAVQHEIDHLDGVLFVDRVSVITRQLIAGKLKKLAKSRSETVTVS